MRGFNRPKPRRPAGIGSYASYVSGFVLSIIFTLMAYSAVVNNWLSGRELILLIASLAILQLLVQLIFFLHLNKERHPKWNMMTFSFAALVVLIVVIGSLWIMYNLDYNMTPHEVNEYIMEEEGIRR